MISVLKNQNKDINYIDLKYFGKDIALKVRNFHKTFAEYKPSPLVELNGFAKHLGIKKIWIKDESHRFNLNAFKILGASYAIAKLFGEIYGIGVNEIFNSVLNKPELIEKIKLTTIVSATDGNHGRSVAWVAKRLGCKCVIYMPKGTSKIRLKNIEILGAEAYIIDGNYDEAVSLAKINATKHGWYIIQDSSWSNYDKIPLWIMQGYLTLTEEIEEQLLTEIPTHIFVQCGVGSLPASILAYYVKKYKHHRPIFIVVEPEDAACLYNSISLNKLSTLGNEMNTIMAGLACGTPSLIAWKILKKYSDYFIKGSDELTISGMQLLGHGLFGDQKIVSGESGAVTTGLVYYLLSNSKNKLYKNKLKLNEKSKILLISTEGNTDPVIYDKILSNYKK